VRNRQTGRRRGLSQGGRDHGAVAVEWLLIFPLVLATVMLVVQYGVYAHARSVAIASAHEGARAAAAEQGTSSQGIRTAREFLAQAGGDDVLTAAQITGSRTAASATVTVSGRALSLFPGLPLRIQQEATMPVERLTQ
jgi:Flp pilus assembly protein TadG